MYRVEDHATGTVQCWVTASDGPEGHDVLYSRQTPNTRDWTAQVREDITDLYPDQPIEVLLYDDTLW